MERLDEAAFLLHTLGERADPASQRIEVDGISVQAFAAEAGVVAATEEVISTRPAPRSTMAGSTRLARWTTAVTWCRAIRS